MSVVDSEPRAVVEGHGSGGNFGKEGRRLEVLIYRIGRRALHVLMVDSIFVWDDETRRVMSRIRQDSSANGGKLCDA